MPDIPALLEAYARGPELLREAVRHTPESGWDATPIAGKWSIRQVVCHLADSEIVYADRMKRVLAEDTPTFFDADPDQFVPALHCEKRQPDSELAVVEAVRRHMLSILRACNSKDFERRGVHSTAGPLTLAELLERVTTHLPHHLRFIEAKLRALGAK
jgi:uncharacterized damage-inducible protein DinB